ncbi:MAG TPA: hypothetical protein VKZ81_10990 [Pseudonocardia sp.]|jgi:hypothetical protein|uniref:hypothetical protein n=1 Tax=Pseudonocardia sp. TaxID=60912 RepID=UPI002B4B70B8|nr:hypothetical protein [Pseudonocardia sp.]HLU55976.1 hypothetical protein [Pseudonocardia sp.]
MDERRTDPSVQDLNRGVLIAAAVLFAVAGLAGPAGFAMFCAALFGATRSWVRRADLGPRELATLKWRQAEAAAGAGAGAWQDHEKHAWSPRSARR